MSARRLYNVPQESIKSARAKLLGLLSDLRWHHNKELHVAGVRYSARLLELKRLGYRIEKRQGDVGYEYRLASLKRDVPRVKTVKVFLAEEDAVAIVKHRRVTDPAHAAIESALASFAANRGKL